jgi:purine-binding chemotaxis protein CheW
MNMEKNKEERENHIEILEFILNNDDTVEKYAIEILYLNEVHNVKKVTQLPCSPSFIIGIINFRGKILSVIDIRNFLGFNTGNIVAEQVKRVIIIKVGEMEFGIAAEGILGCNEIPMSHIQKDVSAITNYKTHYFKGITKERCIILDIKNIALDERIIVNEEVI